MIEGLWSGEWKSNVSNIQNHAAGVFILESGKIYGGNTTYYYFGNYEVQDDKIKGTLEFQHFSGDPIGIMGYSEQGSLLFEGRLVDNRIDLLLKMKESGLVRMDGVLTKRLNLKEEYGASFDLLSGKLPEG